MRPGPAVTVYLLVVFLGGALAAPWLYHGVHAAATVIPALEPLAAHPFSRYLSRAWLLTALLGLWPLLRAVGMNSWPALGLANPRSQRSRLAQGLVLALALSVGVFALACVANARTLHSGRSWAEVGERMLKAGQAAVFVSVIEEVLFRGVLFGALRRAALGAVALGFSSAFYAWVHFLGSLPAPAAVDWASGLAGLGAALPSSLAATFTPAFLNLALAGLILGLGYERGGGLLFPIGLHAGWILGLKLGAFATQRVPGTSSAFWGSGGMVDGWCISAMLGVLVVVGLRLPKPAPRTEDTPWQSPTSAR